MTRAPPHRPWRSVAVAGLLATSLPALATPSSPRGVRRLALIAGANDGGPDRAQLRYAASDARSVSGVLTELGGVSPADRVLLVNPDRAAMAAAFEQLGQRLAEVPEGQRTEVIVYYSGHSDERGLLLGTERYSYKDLRASVKALNSDVRIAILDSCSSGALVQGKGGKHVPGFLDDGQNKVEGHAFLTSSAADEVSQEAESIGGSFFTNALVTGMRGAADANNDRLITLNEAYRFAYDETLSRTESTRFGAQHANFDMDLSGSGDLVMTDLRQRTASLHLEAPLEGRLFVRDPGGKIIAELGKNAGQGVDLLVEPGSYTLTLERPEGLYRRTARVTGAVPVAVAFSDFEASTVQATASRGSERMPPGNGVVRVAIDTIANIGVAVGEHAADGFEVGVVTLGDALDGAALSLGTSHYGAVSGAQISVGLNTATESVDGAQLAVGMNLSEGPLRGFQGAVGINIGNELQNSAQLAAGINIAGGGRGAQLAAGANIVQDDFNGAQLAAGANLATGAIHGVQLASGYNWAPEVHGLQGAVINTARDVEGAQLGVINQAGDVKGAMVGVINIANSVEGPTVGIINIVKDGIHDIEVYYSPISRTTGTFKMGSKVFYTGLTAGFDDQDRYGYGKWMFGAALGTRSDFGPFTFDVDLGADTLGAIQNTVRTQPQVVAPRARFVLCLPLGRWVQPFAGMTAAWGIQLDGAEGDELANGLVQFQDQGTQGGWVSWEFGARF